jgi:hypothetical protein
MTGASTEELLYNIGRCLILAAAMPPTCDVAMALAERMSHPRPGDLVIEVSSIGRPFDPDSVGRLLRTELARHDDRRYVIEPLSRPGGEAHWLNASIVALPDERRMHLWAQS